MMILTPVLWNLLAQSLFTSDFFLVLSAFVAVNTILYGSLAIAKILPKIHFSKFDRRRHRRSETRSIYPDGPV